jgi:methylated-DNA-[protein]-cysteine S-methyltransferase
MTLCHTAVSTPLGTLCIAATEHALAGVWFQGQKHAPDRPQGARRDDHPLLQKATRQVQALLAGQPADFDLPLHDAVGTPFQRQVWEQVSRIPRGQVRRYADIARAIGRPQAARAVGAAVGRNPWILLVPCHRVVGHDGRLTGYAAGLERKQQLLKMEGALH